jgi:tetratricopeptide (TPR) repeat protein
VNAVSNYNIALKHNRTNPDVRYNMAIAYYTLGKEQLTFHHLRKIINDHPDYADAYLLRGYIFSKSHKRHYKAIDDLNRFLELIPYGPDAETAKAIIDQLNNTD